MKRKSSALKKQGNSMFERIINLTESFIGGVIVAAVAAFVLMNVQPASAAQQQVLVEPLPPVVELEVPDPQFDAVVEETGRQTREMIIHSILQKYDACMAQEIERVCDEALFNMFKVFKNLP